MAHFFFFQLLPLLIMSLLMIPSAHANLFVEYIGALYTGVKFTDVPINPGITNFQFVLAFGIDYTASAPHTPTDGHFNVFWDNGNLGASQIAAIKASHPNVKVALSIGGDTVGGTPVQFSPSSVDAWVANAVSSLTGLINQYHLDGIDIDYEHFGTTTPDTFAECIGRLITTLKSSGAIRFASIAPFPAVDQYYTALWRKYGSVINHVNYQFYAYDSSTTVPQFLGYFNAASAKYSGGNVLVSFSTQSPAGGLLPGKGFWRAADTLKSQGKLHGIFVWTADSSKSNGFSWDSQAQSVLVS
ncbi:chitinase 2-like [Iris pallida]|uniref:Chitinase 2-like n=1 Tax=Iris pallida TaxID=29817 RepID=A0AAX6HCL9_IRIPA|nr:chitinase 2-like [Iris pallida]